MWTESRSRHRYSRQQQACMYWNRKRRRAAASSAPAVTAPIVANQALAFGALTLSGAGGIAPTNTGAAITSASIDSGNGLGHFGINPDGTIYVTADGDTANLSAGTYVFVCTFNSGERI